MYSLIRVFTLVFPGGPPWICTLVLAMSAATMIVGLVGAAAESDFRRMVIALVSFLGTVAYARYIEKDKES